MRLMLDREARLDFDNVGLYGTSTGSESIGRSTVCQ